MAWSTWSSTATSCARRSPACSTTWRPRRRPSSPPACGRGRGWARRPNGVQARLAPTPNPSRKREGDLKDFAASEDPAVQAQLDRLAALSLPQGRLGLDVIHELLARLGEPHKRLPPTFHVAGTNGKGSTCAYLRAILEAEGLTVHAAIKPHLVRYNERIRLAGELISDGELAPVLKEVLDLGEDLGPSFFEVTTAATFL